MITLEAPTETESTSLQLQPESAVPARPSHRVFNIPGDDCNRATEHLPEEQRNLIRWLHHHAWTNDISTADLGGMLKRNDGKTYAGNTIYKIFKGLHEAELDTFVDAVRAFKKVIDQRATITRSPFVATRLAKRIFKICESARIYQTIEFIYGAPQIGKTTALEQYALENNHGQTVFWRLPAGGGFGRSVEELAIACRFSAQQKANEILRRAVRFFTPEMLLIVDEAHQMFLGDKRRGRIETAELIREIHDRSKVGVVIAATPALEKEIQEGKSKDLLRQLDLRSLGPNRLPDRPDAKDLDTFAAHYNLPPAKTDAAAFKLQNEIIAYEGLGRWLKRLMAASHIAHKRGDTKLTWGHVFDADTFVRRKAQPTLN